MVSKAGRRVGVELRPHDLRRHAATYASRAGTPIEIVSKVILRHANLSTTQRYLGPKPGEEVTEEGVIEFCRGRLAKYKIPKKVAFVSELPRTATGKILKKELKAKYLP